MKLRAKLSLTVLSSLILLGITGCEQTQPNEFVSGTADGLNVHIIDVGQGDSILLECDNNYMLIDAGESEYGIEVVDYLEQYNIDRLSYIVVTHPHSDHYGGVKTVLENVETENVIITEAYNTTRSWESLIDYVDSNNYNVKIAESNDTFELGECNVTAYVPEIDNDDLNNCSIVLKAEYDEMSALFTGDAERLEELTMLESGFDVNADVLKIGHHGSRTSTSQDFFERVNPQLALISCGKDNDYGHPHKETTALLKENSVKFLRTDEQGSIIINMKNDTLNVNTTNGYSESFNLKDNSATDNTNNIGNEYVGNKNSKVYHSIDCAAVKKMSDKNKVVFSSAEEAEEDGYKPCKNCNP